MTTSHPVQGCQNKEVCTASALLVLPLTSQFTTWSFDRTVQSSVFIPKWIGFDICWFECDICRERQSKAAPLEKELSIYIGMAGLSSMYWQDSSIDLRKEKKTAYAEKVVKQKVHHRQ